MKRLRAFTLIETLIVIVIFCVGILTVLNGLSQTLRNKDYANIQIKSAFFAREGIELMFNMRDANYRKELRRNCIFNKDRFNPDTPYEEDVEPFCDGFFASGNILKIGIGTSDKFIDAEIIDKLDDDFDENLSKFQIYLHTGSDLNGFTGYLYNHDSKDGEETGFGRYLLIKEVSDGENTVDSDKLLKIESHVLYKRGYLTGEKVMETFIGNYEFNQ